MEPGVPLLPIFVAVHYYRLRDRLCLTVLGDVLESLVYYSKEHTRLPQGWRREELSDMAEAVADTLHKRFAGEPAHV